jgi:hypothetical protein
MPVCRRAPRRETGPAILKAPHPLQHFIIIAITAAGGGGALLPRPVVIGETRMVRWREDKLTSDSIENLLRWLLDDGSLPSSIRNVASCCQK